MLKDEPSLTERIAIEQQVISRINAEFYNYENKDFTINMYETTIVVHYDEVTAYITASGRHAFNSVLIYNDPYGTIADYRYE